MAELLDRIVEQGSGDFYYCFANADGKRWLMPGRNLRMAMQLYQPSGWKGRALKALFPWLHEVGMLRRALHITCERRTLRPGLKGLFSLTFPDFRVEVAIFCGTPCVHQKSTMQLSCGKKLLGYCKLTDNAEVAALFKREFALLAELAERGMAEDELPRVLYCGEVEPGLFAFVQSTEKSVRSRVPHAWSALHDGYLARLHACTKQRLPFSETDYAHALSALESHTDWVPDLPGKASVIHALARVRAAYAGQEVEFSAYHADFTPWNMFEEKGKLFVFDWEYALRTCPPGLDRYHWYTQTAIFERRLGAVGILAEVPVLPWMQRELYLAYLLEVLSRFTLREQGRVEGDVARSFAIWLELIEKLSS